jgi:hypothetical protein
VKHQEAPLVAGGKEVSHKRLMLLEERVFWMFL